MNVVLKDSYNEMDEVQVRARANVNEIDVRAKTGVVNEVDVRRMNNKPVWIWRLPCKEWLRG